MKTRIVSFNKHFFPQWHDGKLWQSYFGYKSHSPYLQMLSFETKSEALAFFSKPHQLLDLGGKVVE
jgi:hypothetical protein